MEERIYGTSQQYSEYYRARNMSDNNAKGQAMKRLAESGFAPAEYWMATAYLNNCAKRYGFKSDTSMDFSDQPFARTPDYVTGVKWAKKAADHKYVYAYKELGSAYKIGKGVRQNYNEALKWYFKAVDEYEYVDEDIEDKTAILADFLAFVSNVYCDMRDFADARKYSKLALETYPDSDLAQLSVGYIDIAMGRR